MSLQNSSQSSSETMNVTAGELVFIILIGLMLAISVVCNVVIMAVVLFNPKMRNPTDVLICNIAVSDLILAACVLPQNLHDISHSAESYLEGDFLCRFVYASPLLCIMNSIFSMVVISAERKRSIVLNVGKKLTVRTVLFIVLAVWVLSFVFSIPTIYEHSQYVNEELQRELGTNDTIYACGSNGVSYTFSLVNGVGLFLVAYAIPLIWLLYNYTRIVLFFRAKGMFGQDAEQRGAVFQAMYKSRIIVVKMLILVALFFAISWAPYFAILIVEKVAGISDVEHAGDAANLLRILLSAFSTAYNFALYVAYNSTFRSGLRRLLRRMCPIKIAPLEHDTVQEFQTQIPVNSVT